MPILLVTYSLGILAPNHATLLGAIKATQQWAKVGANTYLVATNETPLELRDRLLRHLRHGDQLWVGIAPAPSAWHGLPENVARWILENQR